MDHDITSPVAAGAAESQRRIRQLHVERRSVQRGARVSRRGAGYVSRRPGQVDLVEVARRTASQLDAELDAMPGFRGERPAGYESPNGFPGRRRPHGRRVDAVEAMLAEATR